MPVDRTPASPDEVLLVERFLDLVDCGASEAAIALAMEGVQQGRTVTDTVQRLLAPAQQLVGSRWHLGHYTVGQEHVASGVVEHVLGLLTAHTPRPGPHHSVAMVCADGEWHTTPARMAALCLRDGGWRVQFLGGSLSPERLTGSLREVAPRAVAISCTLPVALLGVSALVEVCRRQQLPTIAGGVGFGPDGLRAQRLGIDAHAIDVGMAADRLTGWLDRPPSRSPRPTVTRLDQERVALAAQRVDLVDASQRALEARIPAVAACDDRERRRVRRDLEDVLRAVEATMLVDDPRLFDDHTTWLRDLRGTRGGPDLVLRAGVRAVAAAVPADLPRARGVLQRGLDILEAAEPVVGSLSSGRQ